MAKLYELTGAFAAIMAADEPAEFEAALAALEGEIEAKVDGLARVIRALEADEEMCKAEAHRLADRAAAAANRARSLKEYIKSNLEALGVDKVKGAGLLFGARLQNNSGPSIMVTDPLALPEQYRKVIPAETVADTAAIVEAWKGGVEVPGAVVQRGRHVRIV